MVGEPAVGRRKRHISPVCLPLTDSGVSFPVELLNIFDVFLPQLLIYPNAAEYVAITLTSPYSYPARIPSTDYLLPHDLTCHSPSLNLAPSMARRRHIL